MTALRWPWRRSLAGVVLALGLGVATVHAQTADGEAARAVGLTAFASDADLRAFLTSAAPNPPPHDGPTEIVVADGPLPVGRPYDSENQEMGPGEGPHVKRHGDLMVVLQRGRLFTVSLAGGGQRAVDWIDAYPPGGGDPSDRYYEIQIVADRVLVIGYSIDHWSFEISRFKLNATGGLKFEDAYQLRAGDGWWSNHFAVRVRDDKLVIYSVQTVEYREESLDALPALRPWSADRSAAGFRRIADPGRIYLPDDLRKGTDLHVKQLQTLTTCNVAAAVMACSATGVLGPYAETFYVASDAVFAWTGPSGVTDSDDPEEPAPAPLPEPALYRLPLDGGPPQALGVHGAPQDQFSFQEDAKDRVLNVLVRSNTQQDVAWRPDFPHGAVALLRIPVAHFSDGPRTVESERYRMLPRPAPSGSFFHNRFIGDHVFYAFGYGVERSYRPDLALTVAAVRGGQAAKLAIWPLESDRIMPLGEDALAIGGHGYQSVRLNVIDLGAGGPPTLSDLYVQPEVAPAGSRANTIYLPDASAPDGGSGVLGFPIGILAPSNTNGDPTDKAAAVVFLRRIDGKFAPLGQLAARAKDAVHDDGHPGWDDLYGGARPLFIGRRVFALLGYELVEGAFTPSGVREIGRVDFTPGPQPHRFASAAPH
jgi:hypothetical protein